MDEMLKSVKAEEVGAGDVIMVNGDGYEVTKVEGFVAPRVDGRSTDGKLPYEGPAVRVHFDKYAPSLRKAMPTYREFPREAVVSLSVES